MKVLIIGSKGFIGSHCADHYRQGGHIVYGCDVVTDYTDKQYFLIDSTNADYKEIFQQVSFDICINCAGAASVPESLKNPRRDFELNVLNLYRLLDAIRVYNNQCKLVHLSSAAVYGNPVQLPVRETDPIAPISPYGLHKHYSEQVCHEFVSCFGLQIAILRPFSVFGKGLTKQLFWDLYQKLEGAGPYTLHGTGNETRDFIHISDLVSLIDIIISKGEFKGNIYNAANGVATSIREIVDVFCEEAGVSQRFSFNNIVKEGDPLYWQADISAIQQLGYRQQTENRKGLKDYITWIRESK